MSLSINDVIKGIVHKDSEGNIVLRGLSADAVLLSDGTTVTEKFEGFASSEALTTAISTAINELKDGDDGTSLSTDYDTLLKISTVLGSLKTTVETFLTGEDNDNETLDRLSELVAAINDNKDTVDALLTDKVNTSDIATDLVTDSGTKVLAASQGVALKALIDALQAEVDSCETDNAMLVSKTITEVPTEWPSDARDDAILFLIEESSDETVVE